MRTLIPVLLVYFIFTIGEIGFIHGKSVLSLSWIQRSGQFSWFYPKIEFQPETEVIPTSDVKRVETDDDDADSTINEDEKNQNESLIKELTNQKSYKLIEETVLQTFHQPALRYCIQKGLFTFQYWKGEKYRIFLTNDQTMILSYKVWPFGWRHYPMKLWITENPNEGGFTIDLVSLNGHRSFQQFMLRLNLVRKDGGKKEDSTTMIGNVYQNKRVSKRLTKSLFEPTIYHIKKLLRENLKLFERRQAQYDQYSKESQTAEEKKKKLELDRIIHPEKYKSKSPTVKKEGKGGGGGSGRYTPSSATQARRQVRKGG